MSTPFFSVIIPTYNRAGLIAKTIDSVLHQTFQNFEIIVVDNKSTDNTVEVLQPYLKENKIRLFVQEKNYERARSRNKGFDEAKGQFVTLLDSDDVIYPGCLSDAYNYYLSHQGIKFFHCGYEIFNEQNKIIGSGDLQQKKNPFKELANGNYISNIGIFIDAAIAREVRVDETPVLIGMEDYDFLLRLLYRVRKVGFISKINCGVLHHPQRTVLTQEMEVIKNRVEYFVNKNLKNQLFREDYAAYKKNFLSSNHLYICGAAATRRLFHQAFVYLFKAAKSDILVIFTIKYWKHCFVIFKYMA
jgi:glycosyltransferase involved in cell wall biosynthesis